MIIPNITTLKVEDFNSEQRKWIGKLLFPINNFILSTVSAINGNITFGDNIPAQTMNVKFYYGGDGDFPKQFKWSIPSRPLEFRVCTATENGVAIGILPVWDYSNGQIFLRSVVKLSTSGNSALIAGALYDLTFRANP